MNSAQPVKQESRPSVSYVDIEDDQVGRRLDNFLLSHLKGVPKTRIYRMLRKGEVRVNKKRVKADYRLVKGDQVRVPPVRQSGDAAPLDPGQRVLERVSRAIIEDSDELIVLNKPSGLAVHGGSGISFGAIEALRALYPGQRFLELVHRLDRDTSGLLLVAKKRSVLRHLHQQIREHRLGKRYLALLKGRWRGGERVVDAPLRTNQRRGGERHVDVHPDGKPSLSRFRVERRFSHETLAKIAIETGRTHQIRVHAQHLGMPVAGDDRYGEPGFNRAMHGLGLNRLFLHAAELDVPMPNGELQRFRAALDPALEDVLEKLEA